MPGSPPACLLAGPPVSTSHSSIRSNRIPGDWLEIEILPEVAQPTLDYSIPTPKGLASMWKKLGGIALLLAVSSFSQQAQAMNIIWNGSQFSGFDATEIGVINGAISMWEYLIVDNNTPNNTFSMQIFEEPIDGGGNTLGVATQYAEHGATLSPIFVRIGIDSADDNSLWDDPTPLDNSEFNPTGNPTTFFALGGSPANGRIDLLTVVLHEIGHGIGFHPFYDDWAALNHASMGLSLDSGRSHTNQGAHPGDFMTAGRTSSVRSLISDLNLTALARAFEYKLTPDIDRDYDVDTSDITTMFQNFTGSVGAAGGLTHKSGDIDADGDVDTFDITFAFQRFTGTSSASLGAGSPVNPVPEPGSLALFALGAVGLLVAAARRKYRGQ